MTSNHHLLALQQGKRLVSLDVFRGATIAGMMMLVPVPGHGTGMIDEPHTNLIAWLDQSLFADVHIYRNGPYDPESLFSTLPAVGTTLLGVMAGIILMSGRDPVEKTARLLLISMHR